jgi:hypothetical protein
LFFFLKNILPHLFLSPQHWLKKVMLKNIFYPIFFCILFLSIYAAEEKKVKEKNNNAAASTQHPMTGIFSTNNGTDIEEKEASALTANSTQQPTTILANTLLPTIEAGTTTKVSKPKNSTKIENQANVDVIIQAPVAKPGEPLLDGIFVAPDKDSLSIAIGGAEIALDITKTNNTVSNTTSQPLNGEKIPESLKGALPAFLLHATDAARRSFFEIENNGNIPKTQYCQAVALWAQQQSPEVLAAFNEYVSNLNATKHAAQQVITEKAKSLSQAAQRANTQIQQIQNDDSLTKTQEQTQINEVFNNLPKKVQKELADLTTNSTV